MGSLSVVIETLGKGKESVSIVVLIFYSPPIFFNGIRYSNFNWNKEPINSSIK